VARPVIVRNTRIRRALANGEHGSAGGAT